MSPTLRSAPTLLVAALVSACATLPDPVVDGEEHIQVLASEWTGERDPLTGAPLPHGATQALDGVACTMRNDKGTWRATTPSTVQVLLSAAPLEVECTKEGYRPARLKLACRSLAHEANRNAQWQTGFTILLVPLAVVAAPVAPHAAAQFAMHAVIHGTGAAVSHAEAQARSNVCSYVGIAPVMEPL